MIDKNFIFNNPIPKGEIPAYSEVKNNFIDEVFIELKESDRIKIDLQYPKLGFENAVNKAYIRKSAYEKLLRAVEILPEEYCFKILDTWRPFKLQKELFYKYSDKIIKDFNLKKISEEEQVKFISQFVADPIENRDYPPMHTTGGAIDLIIIKDNGEEMDLGVKFDEFSSKTNTAYFEDRDEKKEIKINRRILYNTMTQAGFTNLSSEVWHYDYGNKNWAYYTKQPGLYKGVFDKNEIKL